MRFKIIKISICFFCFLCLSVGLVGCQKISSIEHVYKSPNMFWGEHVAVDSNGDVYYVEHGSPDHLIMKHVISGEKNHLFTAENIHSISVGKDAIYFIGDRKICRYNRNVDSVEYLYDLLSDQCSLLAEDDKVALTTWETHKAHPRGTRYSINNQIFEYRDHMLTEVEHFQIPSGSHEVPDALATEISAMNHFYQFYVNISSESYQEFDIVDSFYLKDDFFCNPGTYKCDFVGNQVVAFKNNGLLYLCTPGIVETGSGMSHESFSIDGDDYGVMPRQSFQQENTIYLVAAISEQKYSETVLKDGIVAIDFQNQTSEIVAVFDEGTTLIGYNDNRLYALKKNGLVYSCDIHGEAVHELGSVDMKQAKKVYVELCDKAVFIGVDYEETTKSFIFDI